MPETLITPLSRWILACAALFGVVVLSVDASAQINPGPPPSQGAAVNPMCPRLEAQLATIDRGGGGDPTKDEQIRRYQEAAAKQQSELDRVTSQAKRMGCDSSGFFSLFSGQSAQCGPVNNQIQQMRANLEQITTSLERLRGGFGGAERDSQRRSVLAALAQNNCGPQYANAPRGPGSFLETLFGNNNNNNNNPMTPGVDLGPQSGTYRTVCVRTCDGFYFPISFATVPARFPDDERTCKNLCPAAEASLFSYRNPGEDMNQAVSINGQPYSSSPNAFRYRQEFNPSCACKAAGQTWSDALKTIDDKASAEQQGDIIVTEESAKKMSRVPTKGAAGAAKKGTAPAGTTATAPAAPEASPPAANPTAAAPDNKPIRSVGPTFIPTR
jgi:Protein of unknown function (DUF2865)